MNTVLTAILNITERLLVNGNASLHFMRGFLSPTPNDVSIDWIKADNTVETYSFANIKKFQEEVTARVNAAINNIKQPKIVFKGMEFSAQSSRCEMATISTGNQYQPKPLIARFQMVMIPSP